MPTMHRLLMRAPGRTIVRAAVLALAVSALSLAGSPDARAKGKGKGKGNGGGSSHHHVSAIVVHPAGFRTQGDDLTIALVEKDDGSGGVILDGVEVRSASPGMHWVHLPLTLPSGSHSGKGRAHDLFVHGVEVCYQEDGGGTELSSSIDVIQLTQLDSPPEEQMEHHDATPRAAPESECVQSLVPWPFHPKGALTLSLKLNFGETDDVFRFGTVRILVSPRDNVRPSAPSQPSQPSGPSQPSQPSGSEG
jgi:hypothetical protein